MINEMKLKQIQALIKTSGILSEQEKIDWTALLELMNDKQLAELEELLNQNKTSSIASSPSQAKPLSSSNRNTQPQRPVVSAVSLENSIARPQPYAIPPTNLPTTTHLDIKSVPQNLPIANYALPVKIKEPLTPPRPIPSQNITPINFAPSIQEVFTQPQKLSEEGLDLSLPLDASKLTNSALHKTNRMRLYEKILALAQKFGYFQVLINFEKSLLYQDYINYGKQRLKNVPNAKLPFSQEEFEFITDLLLSLKINRA